MNEFDDLNNVNINAAIGKHFPKKAGRSSKSKRNRPGRTERVTHDEDFEVAEVIETPVTDVSEKAAQEAVTDEVIAESTDTISTTPEEPTTMDNTSAPAPDANPSVDEERIRLEALEQAAEEAAREREELAEQYNRRARLRAQMAEEQAAERAEQEAKAAYEEAVNANAAAAAQRRKDAAQAKAKEAANAKADMVSVLSKEQDAGISIKDFDDHSFWTVFKNVFSIFGKKSNGVFNFTGASVLKNTELSPELRGTVIPGFLEHLSRSGLCTTRHDRNPGSDVYSCTLTLGSGVELRLSATHQLGERIGSFTYTKGLVYDPVLDTVGIFKKTEDSHAAFGKPDVITLDEFLDSIARVISIPVEGAANVLKESLKAPKNAR